MSFAINICNKILSKTTNNKKYKEQIKELQFEVMILIKKDNFNVFTVFESNPLVKRIKINNETKIF